MLHDPTPFLLAGHGLADLVLRARGAAHDAARTVRLLPLLLVVHVLCILPVATTASLVGLLGVVVVQLALLTARPRGTEDAARPDGALRRVLVLQALHVAVAVGAGAAVVAFTDPDAWRHDHLVGALGGGSLPAGVSLLLMKLAAAVPFVAAWTLVAGPGGDAVRWVLERSHALPGTTRQEAGVLRVDPRLGRTIGVLERLLVVTLVLQAAWAGIGLILAAKSVARFRELEDRAFGEYYLVGTLASVLVAVLVGLLVGGVPAAGGAG